MTNKTISALSSASTIVGTEVLPIVQSSATVKVSVANLTSGLGTIIATKGGTGQTSYAVGDLLYADTTTTLAKLPDVATGNALISGGVSTASSWGKIGLTTHVSGVLPVANGGTNASTASITSFNNITGYSASGATGTTTTNLVFSTSPSITTPTLVGNATLSTGNLVIGTSGKGIDFSAAGGTGTSELLSDYEEGTWTPSLGGSATYVENSGQYTKVGRLVNVRCCVSVNVLGTGNNNTISGLPFTSFTTTSGNPTASISVGYFNSVALSTTYISGFIASNSTTIVLSGTTIPGTGATAARQTFGNGARVDLTATYFV